MDLAEFKIVTKEIENYISRNRRVIEDAINEEQSKGNSVNLNKVLNIIRKFETINLNVKEEGQKIAVCYTGNPEITITYILDSILYNNNVTLCISDNQKFNDVLIKIITDCIRGLKRANEWINYNENYTEIYIRDNLKHIDKIVYVGDFFEYQRLKNFLKTDVEYNNYGYIKIFINRAQYESEYYDIVMYCRKSNLTLEVYEDIDDFISESKDTDYSVVFGNTNELNRIKRELRCGEMLINAFPYNAYEFRINR